jgi:3-dehydroquinate synthase
MPTIKVNLAEKSYEIEIGAGILDSLGPSLSVAGFKGKVVIITNPLIKRLYGDKVIGQLNAAGFETLLLQVPDGEKFKSLEQAGKLYEQLGEFKAERSTPLIALGGGVIGDLAGFVAATYLRGVPLVQIPTTLLAQVDSSIGGKVAVNHGSLKNNIGTFYQPRLVIADISTLNTLPREEFQNGMAEVIKYGVIRDNELFELIENNPQPQGELLVEMITRCVAIKAAVVEDDEKDTGLRNILNFGHTVGHAIEIVSGYKVKHGQGVAIGMVAAAAVSEQMGYSSRSDTARIKKVITQTGLPVKIPHLDVNKVIQAMQHDKKRIGGQMRFILFNGIGDALINDEIQPEMLVDLLREMNE